MRKWDRSINAGLTGITRRDVSDAPRFGEALDAMTQWMHAFSDALFCSWGDYDRKQLIQDSEYNPIGYPFPTRHLNLKAEFSRSPLLGRSAKMACEGK